MGCAYSLPDNLRDEIIEAQQNQELNQSAVIKESTKIESQSKQYYSWAYVWR